MNLATVEVVAKRSTACIPGGRWGKEGELSMSSAKGGRVSGVTREDG